MSQVIEALFLRLGYKVRGEISTPKNSLIFQGVDGFDEIELIGVCGRTVAIRNTAAAEELVSNFISDVRALFSLRPSIETTGSRALHRVFAVSTVAISASVRDALQAEFAGRLTVWQYDDLVRLIDKHLPQLWRRVDAHTHSYLARIAEELSADSFHPQSLALTRNEAFLNASIDDRYIEVTGYRHIVKPRTRNGQTVLEQDIEEVPIIQLRTRNERLISLLGDAGSGKSTAVRRMAYLMARQSMDDEIIAGIPVLLRATEIIERDCATLVECARGLIKGAPDRLPFTEEDLSAGKVHFFIDGLDEVSGDDLRAKVIRYATSFNRAYPQCQVVLATRNYSSIRELPEFHQFTAFNISEMSVAQAENLVKKLLKGAKTEDVEPLLRDVFGRLQEVHGVQLSPLLVAVFVATTDSERTDVPANITEMFKKWAELMLGRWDWSKGLDKQYQAQLKDYIVQHIAFKMHTENDRRISEADFQSTVREYLNERGLGADLPQVLDELLGRSGLFKRSAGIIEFRHHMIQEFFAGRSIPDEDFISKVIGQEWWRMPIVFYFGSRPDNAKGLKDSLRRAGSLDHEDALAASITIGLALQASYLTKMPEKQDVFQDVLRGLADGEADFTQSASDGGRLPYLGTAYYYLACRDSVALGPLRQFAEDIYFTDQGEGSHDTVQFWTIIGLLETYQLEQASRLIKKFRPKDLRLLVGIDMACGLRRDSEKKIAKRIRQDLDERIGNVRRYLYKEIQTTFSEIREKRYKQALETHAKGLEAELSSEASIADSKEVHPEPSSSSRA